MVWKRTYWNIANLDSEFPGWRERFQCADGHPLFDIYRELIDLNNEREDKLKVDYLSMSFYVDRSMNHEGVKFLCGSHWIGRYPSSFLFAYAGMVSRNRPYKERREIVRKAFVYANKHGYGEAIRYLERFKMRAIE